MAYGAKNPSLSVPSVCSVGNHSRVWVQEAVIFEEFSSEALLGESLGGTIVMWD